MFWSWSTLITSLVFLESFGSWRSKVDVHPRRRQLSGCTNSNNKKKDRRRRNRRWRSLSWTSLSHIMHRGVKRECGRTGGLALQASVTYSSYTSPQQVCDWHFDGEHLWLNLLSLLSPSATLCKHLFQVEHASQLLQAHKPQLGPQRMTFKSNLI